MRTAAVPLARIYAERFVRSIKDECLKSDGLHLAGIVTPGRGRIHGSLPRRTQSLGLENRLIRTPAVVAANDSAIYRHARLGVTLSFYYRNAA